MQTLPPQEEGVKPDRSAFRRFGAGDCNEATPHSPFFGCFTELEPISPDWIPYLTEHLKYARNNVALNVQDLPYLRRLGVYFIYRYFLKGTFDGEIVSRVKLAAVSVWLIGCLWECERLSRGNCSFEEMCLIAKNYSKEVEYSEENLDALADMFYDRDRKEYYCLRCQFTGTEKKILEWNELVRLRYGAMNQRITKFDFD